jgi:small acid-soluble spore protein F (minor alpha/beta-type SASP)
MNPKKKADTQKKKKPLTPQERLKLKIAKELGLYERVKKDGWSGLSAQECGRIGGQLSRRLREGGMGK